MKINVKKDKKTRISTHFFLSKSEINNTSAYYEDPNKRRGWNNSREWKIIQNLIKVGVGINVGGGNKKLSP